MSDRLLQGVELVTFDIFDTLVLRSCQEPAAIFDIVEERWNKEHEDMPIAGFRAKRMDAERKARLAAGSSVEVTVEDIYAYVSCGQEGMRTELMRLEESCEYDVCMPNQKLVALFHEVSRNRRVAIVSDMYLPSTIIVNILNKCGIEGYEKLYVSSDCGAMKRNGRLFGLVLSELGVEPARALHIGDHALADYLAPKMMGLRAFLYRAKIKPIASHVN